MRPCGRYPSRTSPTKTDGRETTSSLDFAPPARRGIGRYAPLLGAGSRISRSLRRTVAAVPARSTACDRKWPILVLSARNARPDPFEQKLDRHPPKRGVVRFYLSNSREQRPTQREFGWRISRWLVAVGFEPRERLSTRSVARSVAGTAPAPTVRRVRRFCREQNRSTRVPPVENAPTPTVGPTVPRGAARAQPASSLHAADAHRAAARAPRDPRALSPRGRAERRRVLAEQAAREDVDDDEIRQVRRGFGRGRRPRGAVPASDQRHGMVPLRPTDTKYGCGR